MSKTKELFNSLVDIELIVESPSKYKVIGTVARDGSKYYAKFISLNFARNKSTGIFDMEARFGNDSIYRTTAAMEDIEYILSKCLSEFLITRKSETVLTQTVPITAAA